MNQVKLFDAATVDWQSDPGTAILTKDDLQTRLSRFLDREPGIVDLVSPNGVRLQLGLGGQYACAQLVPANNLPPYLVALAPQITASDGVEFLLGDTPTPVAPEQCISVADGMLIAEYFFETGKPHLGFRWQKV